MKSCFDLQSGWRRASPALKWLIIGILILMAARIALPCIIKDYVNHELNNAHDYSGKIGHIDMQLWRGGYRIQQIQIFKKSGEVQSPLFSAPQVDLSVEWRELFHGSLMGKLAFLNPKINFVNGPSLAQKQTGENENWDKMLIRLFPFKLNRVQILNGEIHYEDPSSKPPVDIYLRNISATATNLTNSRETTQKLPSGLVASASAIGGGILNLQLHMNLLKSAPTFEMNCELTNVDLVALNEFLRAYGKFDVAHGTFALYTSLAADDGNFAGYFKVFLKNLDVFQWEKERKKNILAIFWQAVVGGVTSVFENHSKAQLATKVPISGSYTNSHIGIWTATATVLQNAFIHALVPKLDQHVTVEQVEKTEDKK